jgi:hypothetical protein
VGACLGRTVNGRPHDRFRRARVLKHFGGIALSTDALTEHAWQTR